MADVPALDLAFAAGPEIRGFHDVLYATLDDFDPIAIEERGTPDGWRVFFHTADARTAAAAALARVRRDRLRSITPIDVPDEDWARRSQAQLTAVRIGRITVSPPWDPAASCVEEREGSIVIVIDPSTGFGTGHHPTTRLCLELLQATPVTERRVIDVGTGSGVIAIAAAKLGAASVLAIDRDRDALNNARENVERNGVSGIVEVRELELAVCAGRSADVVVANLTGTAIQQHARTLAGLMASEGALILGGFAPDELAQIERAFGTAAGDSCAQDGWTAARFTRLPKGV